jgi:hypothetical protein
MINKIIKKYGGHSNYWFPEVKEKNLYRNKEIKAKYSVGCSEAEAKLFEKYGKYIPKGWYGFSLGSPLHLDWFKIIDEFLEYLVGLQEKGKISGFEIHQVKLKLGSIRCHVSWKTDDDELDEYIRLQIRVLERHLEDKKLIY